MKIPYYLVSNFYSIIKKTYTYIVMRTAKKTSLPFSIMLLPFHLFQPLYRHI